MKKRFYPSTYIQFRTVSPYLYLLYDGILGFVPVPGTRTCMAYPYSLDITEGLK